MRQVGEAELVWNVRYQLGRLSASLRNGLAAQSPDVRRSAEQRIAEQLVSGALGRFEILSDAPLPEGSDLYSRAAFGEGKVYID